MCFKITGEINKLLLVLLFLSLKISIYHSNLSASQAPYKYYLLDLSMHNFPPRPPLQAV